MGKREIPAEGGGKGVFLQSGEYVVKKENKPS